MRHWGIKTGRLAHLELAGVHIASEAAGEGNVVRERRSNEPLQLSTEELQGESGQKDGRQVGRLNQEELKPKSRIELGDSALVERLEVICLSCFRG